MNLVDRVLADNRVLAELDDAHRVELGIVRAGRRAAADRVAELEAGTDLAEALAEADRWRDVAIRAREELAEQVAIAASFATQMWQLSAALAARDHALAHDPLTGCLSRTGLYAAYSTGQWAGLLLLDLDRFKAINDTHGHAAGDAVLIALADRLRQAHPGLPERVARLGGDEFAILTPAGTPISAGVTTWQAIAGQPLAAGEHEHFEVVASIGTTRLAAGEPLEAAMARADAALYRAKATGGVQRWHPGITAPALPAQARRTHRPHTTAVAEVAA